MKYYVSWSGGKDSTATIILAHLHNIPIDGIIFSEVMFDKSRGISGELPEHIFNEMKHFFTVYKALEGMETAVERIDNRAAAVAIIKRAMEQYDKKKMRSEM